MRNSINKFIVYTLTLICFVGCEANFDPEGSSSGLAKSTIKVNAFSLVKRQKEFIEETQLFYNGSIPDEDLRLRVRAYFYKNNELVGTASGLYSNLMDNISMSRSDLSMGTKYSVVVVADFVILAGNTIDLEFWAVQDESDYRNIKIVDQGYTGLQYRSVGIAHATIQGGDDASVDIKGLGMLAYMYFSSIDSDNTQKIRYTWTDVKEYLLTEQRATYTTTYVDSFESDPNYSGFYDYRYILPMSGNTCEFSWEIYNTSGSISLEGVETIQITPSDNRIWNVDCSTNQFANYSFNF